MTLSTSLVLAVWMDACRIWTSQWASLTIESLWLSGRASERGIRSLRFDSSWWLRIYSLSHAHNKRLLFLFQRTSATILTNGHSTTTTYAFPFHVQGNYVPTHVLEKVTGHCNTSKRGYFPRLPSEIKQNSF